MSNYRINDREPREVLIQVAPNAIWEHYYWFASPRAASEACERLGGAQGAPAAAPLFDQVTQRRYDLDSQYIWDDPYLLNNAGSIE